MRMLVLSLMYCPLGFVFAAVAVLVQGEALAWMHVLDN